MTKKYTKRQYLADLAANDAAMIENEKALAAFQSRCDAGEWSDEMSDAWNAEHDKTYEIECERKDIERRWNRRNWTWQDWSEHELVSQNID